MEVMENIMTNKIVKKINNFLWYKTNFYKLFSYSLLIGLANLENRRNWNYRTKEQIYGENRGLI
jgi:hypothetical protein